jgi:UDP-N-acetylglucosamine 2-epimerase (non-hydrolysing)
MMTRTLNILIVIGTRPEAIKMSPLVSALKCDPDMRLKVCVTAQHREMLDQILNVFDIQPDFDLNLMRRGQDLAELTSNVMLGVKQVLIQDKFDLVLVHGDTTTTLGAGLAAFYERVPVGHVEAGLRTWDISSPWPEELNRSVVAKLAKLHFAPSERARQNLLNERISPKQIHVTGNTVVDALFFIRDRLNRNALLQQTLRARFREQINGKKLVLVTAHRRENIGHGIGAVCGAIQQLAQRPDVEVIFPVHLNPNVRDQVFAQLEATPNVHLIEPQDYVSFVYLMMHASVIITDSGGIQEEAPSLGVPVLVARTLTERTEMIDLGMVKLVDNDADRIVELASRILDDKLGNVTTRCATNPYGDGMAAERIRDIIRESYGLIARDFEQDVPYLSQATG